MLRNGAFDGLRDNIRYCNQTILHFSFSLVIKVSLLLSCAQICSADSLSDVKSACHTFHGFESICLALTLIDHGRAIGEYAEQGGSKDAKKLADKFFISVEGFDFTLFQAKRNEQAVGTESETALKTAVSSIDRYAYTS